MPVNLHYLGANIEPCWILPLLASLTSEKYPTKLGYLNSLQILIAKFGSPNPHACPLLEHSTHTDLTFKQILMDYKLTTLVQDECRLLPGSSQYPITVFSAVSYSPSTVFNTVQYSPVKSQYSLQYSPVQYSFHYPTSGGWSRFSVVQCSIVYCSAV